MQDAAERQFLGDDGLQRDDHHRCQHRAGKRRVTVVEEHRPRPGQQRADRDDGQDEGNRGRGVSDAGFPLLPAQAELGPAQTTGPHQHQQYDRRRGNHHDAGPRG